MNDINPKEYICKICNCKYASRQSLWKHNQRLHLKNTNVIQPTDDIIQPEIQLKIQPEIKFKINEQSIDHKLTCRQCNKQFSFSQSKYRHEKICNKKYKQTIQQTENEELKKEISIMKQQLLELMNKQCKMHPKTLRKINKQLINNTTNNTTNIINNNTIINILPLGHENLMETFSKNDKLKVLQNRYMSLDYLVKYVHFNDNYPQFKNVIITNHQNNIGYKFDNNSNQFIAINKNELLNEVIDERMCDISFFHEQLINELDVKTKDIIDKFISKMDNDKYKDNKKKDIQLIIYNNRNKVSKEVYKNLEIIL